MYVQYLNKSVYVNDNFCLSKFANNVNTQVLQNTEKLKFLFKLTEIQIS